MEPERLPVEPSPASRCYDCGASPSSAETAASRTSYPEGYQAARFGCHDEQMMKQQRLSSAKCDRETNKMTGWGAQIKPEDREAIIKYLSDRFKQ
jgi:hypothetical protein